MSPSSETSLRLVTFCTPLEYLYLVTIFHRHLENLRMSFTSTVQCQRRLTNLVETSKFVSLSCLLWRLSVPFFCTNGKYKACSFTWVIELSFSFVVKLKQRCSSYPFLPFSPFLANFEAFFVPSDPFPYQRIIIDIRDIRTRDWKQRAPPIEC